MEVTPMAKYYVESGTLRCVVSAENARAAALWAVHRAMQQIMPLDDPADATPELKQQRSREGVMVLGSTVRTSERGYGGTDGEQLPTFEVVTQWNQLVNTLDRLEGLLGRI
ncbi:MAG: hypothetical protein ACO1RT_20450 [Planctomycetaceae bacterium]